jgi:hypothetical protein
MRLLGQIAALLFVFVLTREGELLVFDGYEDVTQAPAPTYDDELLEFNDSLVSVPMPWLDDAPATPETEEP